MIHGPCECGSPSCYKCRKCGKSLCQKCYDAHECKTEVVDVVKPANPEVVKPFVLDPKPAKGKPYKKV